MRAVAAEPGVPDGYRIWWDAVARRFGWAGSWPDDGVGGTLHGSERTYTAAVKAAQENERWHKLARA